MGVRIFFRKKYGGSKKIQGKIWGLENLFRKNYAFVMYVVLKLVQKLWGSENIFSKNMGVRN